MVLYTSICMIYDNDSKIAIFWGKIDFKNKQTKDCAMIFELN